MAKVLKYVRTCRSHPSQWEGTLDDGKCFYARYRNSEFSVGTGDDLRAAVHHSFQTRIKDEGGDGFAGLLTDQEMRARMELRGFDMSQAELEPKEPEPSSIIDLSNFKP